MNEANLKSLSDIMMLYIKFKNSLQVDIICSLQFEDRYQWKEVPRFDLDYHGYWHTPTRRPCPIYQARKVLQVNNSSICLLFILIKSLPHFHFCNQIVIFNRTITFRANNLKLTIKKKRSVGIEPRMLLIRRSARPSCLFVFFCCSRHFCNFCWWCLHFPLRTPTLLANPLLTLSGLPNPLLEPFDLDLPAWFTFSYLELWWFTTPPTFRANTRPYKDLRLFTSSNSWILGQKGERSGMFTMGFEKSFESSGGL